MKLTGRRESSNVDDRRGMSTAGIGGIGIGGVIVAALMAWLMGGNPIEALQSAKELLGILEEVGFLERHGGHHQSAEQGEAEF